MPTTSLTTPAQRSTSSLPAPIDAGLSRHLAAEWSQIVPADPAERTWSRVPGAPAPSVALRKALATRLTAVTASMAARDNRAVGAALAATLNVMANRGGDPAQTVAAYTADLADLPSWAVIEALRRCRSGEGPSRTWAPTAPEVRAIVADVLVPYRAEQHRISAVLAAKATPGRPQLPPDRRAAIEAGLRDLGAGMAPKRPRQPVEWGPGVDVPPMERPTADAPSPVRAESDTAATPLARRSA